jgi:hypothetical protein
MTTLGFGFDFDFIRVERASYRGYSALSRSPGSASRGERMGLDEEVAIGGDERHRLALLELLVEDLGE